MKIMIGYRAASRLSWRGVALFSALLVVPAAVARDEGHLSEVTVTATRPLGEIGIQRVAIDSAALRDNISLSMADVIGSNSSVFVKTSGRATLSTVSFRGAAASHTQTTWNGMPVNSPSLGMTDFSLIPAYFIDRASLLYGSSSLVESPGALGGTVALSSSSAGIADGWRARYVQGVGSFATFDEFLNVSHGGPRWKLSTRAVCSTSRNDFKFLNRDKKLNIYDDDRNIIGQYHPQERNRNGAYRDVHILQDVYFTPRAADRLGLNVWFTCSDREIPLTTVDYADDRRYENRQRENTLRSVLSWNHSAGEWRTEVTAGYMHTRLAYKYAFEITDGVMNRLTDSRTITDSFFGRIRGDWNPVDGLFVTTSAAVGRHEVSSVNRASLNGDLGYDRHRAETSLSASARWQATDRLGAAVLARGEFRGSGGAAFVPAFFCDWLLSRHGNVMVKASVSRNRHFPSLNDLYFIPGGNPGLRPESGFTYDAGVSFGGVGAGCAVIGASASWFDSRIDDWILWLPTNKGFFSPRNMKNVHAYGIEARADVGMTPVGGLAVDLDGSFSWTPSVNVGDPVSAGDHSVGRQLPYVPEFSASASARIGWRSWGLLYKWGYYSRRYTMSSGESGVSGSLSPYFMSDFSIDRTFSLRRLDLSLKMAVNNLFDADYQTVMSRPMPGINFEFFVSLTLK